MVKESLHVSEALAILNDLVRLDPAAMTALLAARVPCNQAMADHPTVQVVDTYHGGIAINGVGFLGVLNGLFGVYDQGPTQGAGPIRAVTDDVTGRVVRFEHNW